MITAAAMSAVTPINGPRCEADNSEAGQLCRRYGLMRDIVAEFFTDVSNPSLVAWFYAGYNQSP